MAITDTETITDNDYRTYGMTPDFMDTRTWTDIPTMRLNDGLNYKAINLLFIACLYVLCILPLFVLNYVKYSFSKCSLHMYINNNFLQPIIFNFNTPIYMYLNSLSHVKFYLSCVYNIFGLPVCIKVFYTQLGIDICLVKYYTETYWLINIYLLIVTILWSTCFDKIPEFNSFEFTPWYMILENSLLCRNVLVFDLGHVYTWKLTCSTLVHITHVYLPVTLHFTFKHKHQNGFENC